MQAQDHPALKRFAELLAAPSPSGREERLAAIICGQAEALGYAPQTDGAGNVWVELEGRRPDGSLCCLAAHMDEIGLVVTRIEPDGVLRVGPSGGLLPVKIGEGPVEVIGDGESIGGLLSFGSGHSMEGDQAVTWADARILTGLSPEALQSGGIRPGSSAVPTRERCGFVLLGDGDDPLVAAWTFDDRMGCVALLRLLETLARDGLQPHDPLLVAFTVHEEGGAHGAKVLAHAHRPEIFIAVDGCPIPPGSGLQLDGRPGVWSKDRVTHYDQRLVRALRRAGRLAGTELQVLVHDQAATDASLVYSVGGAPRVGAVGHVRENSHGYEVARLSVFDNLLRTLVAFVVSGEA